MSPKASRRRATRLSLDSLEPRSLLTATAVLDGDVLQITGGPGNDLIEVQKRGRNLVVLDAGTVVGSFPSNQVAGLGILGGDGDDQITVSQLVSQNATINGGNGNDQLQGGAGSDTIVGGTGRDKFIGGKNFNTYFSDDPIDNDTPDELNDDDVFSAAPGLNLNLNTGLFLDPAVPSTAQLFGTATNTASILLKRDEVELLLNRASAAAPSNDGIIAIVDRGGNILGVRVEAGVSPAITGDPQKLAFAIDGAVAKARTGAFFSNDTAPLTTRTVQNLSETTILQRMVESDPNDKDPNSVLRGPGVVAPMGIGGHFPRGVDFSPQVDLAQIEFTNRDTTNHPGPDYILGTPDDIPLPNRFNVPDQFIPDRLKNEMGDVTDFINPPNSYGFESGIDPDAQPRGIGTLPGGVPILRAYKAFLPGGRRKIRAANIGGLGVFFPGETGFASEENSNLNGLAYDPTRPDRSREAEAIAIAALGGLRDVTRVQPRLTLPLPVNDIGPFPNIADIVLPTGRIDLVGITLDIYGGHGLDGIKNVQRQFELLGISANDTDNPSTGMNQPVNEAGMTAIDGVLVPEGFIVTPHASADGSLTVDDLIKMTAQAVVQANNTRAAIRLPLDESARMIIAITDTQGNLLSLYRMPDATFFSLDVATAKARNVAYYNDIDALQEVDRIPTIPRGTAFTGRTFRYAYLPFFPSGQDNNPPGPFSVLNDGQTIKGSFMNNGAPLPATAFQSVSGYNAFVPQSNFRDPTDVANQNGVIFFPGSAGVYKDTDGDGIRELVGGYGISGDGVDQDDVVTYFGVRGYEPSFVNRRADFTFFRGVRLPYQKFNRQPLNEQGRTPDAFPSLRKVGPLP